MKFHMFWFCLLLIVPFKNSFSLERPWLVREEILSSDGAAFDCHSSSIVETVPGRFCVVWKGGPGEGKSNGEMTKNVGIWRVLFHCQSWSEPEEIVQAPDTVCWNPVLCQLPSGEILLFYYTGKDPRHAVSYVKRSYDGGISWSPPELLPAGISGPRKNKPIVTSEGELICPASLELEHLATSCWIDHSSDEARSWARVGPFYLQERPFGVIEPTLFYDAQRNLKMLCRDRAYRKGGMGYLWMAESADGGWSWSPLRKTSLPNPDAAIDVADLGGGKIVLCYNHSHTQRFPLNLAVSQDGGEHWSDPWDLEERSGEFPAMIVSSDGLIHITYAWCPEQQAQRRIKHVVINPDVLTRE